MSSSKWKKVYNSTFFNGESQLPEMVAGFLYIMK